MINQLKRIIKKNKGVEKVYKDINAMVNFNPGIGEITPLNARVSTVTVKRLNLLVPSINQEHIFGGISTAIKFYEQLAAHLGYQSRIITTDATPSMDDMSKFAKYTLVTNEEDIEGDYTIVPFSDRYGKTIPVGKNDVFMSTAWWTAYATHNLIRWQAQIYEQDIKKSLYFIQDFEPGFYAWSSRYALADSTYKIDLPQIAVFNTSLLRDYFKQNGYSFAEEYYFEPSLNEGLKEQLIKVKSFNKKKQILVYGRPSVERNAFELIIETLKIWVWQQPDIREWTIYSIGEKHANVDLGNNVTLKSLGKLTLQGYAELMIESYLGISLMISPHPSYPPLEMSTFGMKVITNTYGNKDIATFNDNIISLDNLSPQKMAHKILVECNGYKQIVENKDLATDYVDGGSIFEFIKGIKF